MCAYVVVVVKCIGVSQNCGKYKLGTKKPRPIAMYIMAHGQSACTYTYSNSMCGGLLAICTAQWWYFKVTGVKSS